MTARPPVAYPVAMALVAAALVPHPKSLVLPKAVTKPFTKTLAGFSTVRNLFIEKDVETIITVSPHILAPLDPYSTTPTDPTSYYVLGLDQLQVALPRLNLEIEPRVFVNDVDFSHQLADRARPFGLKLLITPHVKVDESTATALVLLNMPRDHQPKLVTLVLPYQSPKDLYEFGQILGGLAEQLTSKIGILAVGNLSSRLSKNAPAGFDGAGAEFDGVVQKAANSGDFIDLVSRDDAFFESAGEEASRPLAVVAAASAKLKSRLVSYEAALGTGHAVLTWS